MTPRPAPLIERVRVANYRSIAACDATLGSLTVLVGPNAAGKSNVLDALAFVAEALETTPHHAIDCRGGMPDILMRGAGPDASFTIALEVKTPGPWADQWARSEYSFEIAPASKRGQRSFEVVSEECTLRREGRTERFRVSRGAVDDPSTPGSELTLEPDRLYLQAASTRPAFAPLFEALRGMRFYNFDPATLRLPRPRSDIASFGRRGERLGDVLGALARHYPSTKERIDSYLAAIAPGVEGIDRREAGTYTAVEMRQRSTDGAVATFGPDGMSDGTILAAGVLTALFQPWVLEGQGFLVGIEIPESALHPAAAGALFDALTEASEHVQVVVTSQSADLLDRDDLDPSILRAVASEGGRTVIGDVNAASLGALREHRFTAGELLRAGQLTPELPPAAEPAPELPVSDRAVALPGHARRPNSVPILVDAGRIRDGTMLEFIGESARERQALAAWLDGDPRRRRATWVNDRRNPLLWSADGRQYSPSGLVEHMRELAGWDEAPIGAAGPEAWVIPGEGSLFELAEEVLRQQEGT